MSGQKQVIVKKYKGSRKKATAAFQADAEKMAKKGYSPTTQDWSQGSWSCGQFIFALILSVVFVGIFIFIYMLLVKPAGTLVVTYELRPASKPAEAMTSANIGQ